MKGLSDLSKRTLFMTQFAMLLVILAFFCFTPLGSIPIGPVVATLAMIPVVITAIVLGTKAGTIMGFCAGLFSFTVMTFMPMDPATAFLFTPFYGGEGYVFSGNAWSLVICFVPRILAGTFTGLTYSCMKRTFANKGPGVLGMSVGAAVGSATNTVLVLGGAWLFFGSQMEELTEKAMMIVIGWLVLTNGIPEAIVAAIAASAVCKPLLKVMGRR
ncbi:MAG: ECF transporter S component [Oscillospiraceae bacterium]|nr:ECF transporter S component [Oscillospiraceae bacterium]